MIDRPSDDSAENCQTPSSGSGVGVFSPELRLRLILLDSLWLAPKLGWVCLAVCLPAPYTRLGDVSSEMHLI